VLVLDVLGVLLRPVLDAVRFVRGLMRDVEKHG
jgi:hypothetical protein